MTVSKSSAYRWLAQFFLGPPDQTLLEAYRAEEGRAFLEACRSVSALAPLAAWMSAEVAAGKDLSNLRDRLGRSYSLAFDMGGPRAAPPYASVYAEGAGLLFQKPTRDMIKLLQSLEMQLPEDLLEPADHLSIQLNLVAELHDRNENQETTPLGADLFLELHLLPWLPLFVERCHALREPGPIHIAASAVLALCLEDIQQANRLAVALPETVP